MSYLTWQFISGPRWLWHFGWNLQRVLLRFFSVPLMVRTLFQHWRKDIVEYRGSLGDRFQTFLFNQVSRGAGFVIRSSILLAWLVTATLLIPISLLTLVLFLLWPLISIALVVAGFAFLTISLI